MCLASDTIGSLLHVTRCDSSPCANAPLVFPTGMNSEEEALHNPPLSLDLEETEETRTFLFLARALKKKSVLIFS